jgi:hypothetical protein
MLIQHLQQQQAYGQAPIVDRQLAPQMGRPLGAAPQRAELQSHSLHVCFAVIDSLLRRPHMAIFNRPVRRRPRRPGSRV